MPTPSCEQSLGFLLPRSCGAPVAAQCLLCGKSVCQDHLSQVDAQTVCVSCAGDLDEEGGDADVDTDADAYSREDDPSYYYKDYGYYGSGSSWAGGASGDPNDFTEADGESLRNEDDASFEEDLGGS